MNLLNWDGSGTPDRLDFTMIGPAVNEAARMEKLTKNLGCARQ